MAGQIHIGTSGFSYEHWTGGAYYPRGLRAAEHLKFYSADFDTVEINSSFYRLPAAGVALRWREQTPPRFVFAMKLWRAITHYRRLRRSADLLNKFFGSTGELDKKYGPLLVQLPPGMKVDLPRLEDFAGQLKAMWRQYFSRRRMRAAVEFRHESWFSPQCRGLLARLGWSLVLAEGGHAVDEPLEKGFIYVRRHGPGGGENGYSESELQALAGRIRDWSGGGRDVFVYYNNDYEAHAVANARRLRAILR